MHCAHPIASNQLGCACNMTQMLTGLGGDKIIELVGPGGLQNGKAEDALARLARRPACAELAL